MFPKVIPPVKSSTASINVTSIRVGRYMKRFLMAPQVRLPVERLGPCTPLPCAPEDCGRLIPSATVRIRIFMVALRRGNDLVLTSELSDQFSVAQHWHQSKCLQSQYHDPSSSYSNRGWDVLPDILGGT